MFEAIFLICIVAYIAFRNWLEHDKRRMLHKERLIAIEKGLEVPAVEQETSRRGWNMQRYLLLAGWSFLFVGVALFITISMIRSVFPPGQQVPDIPPEGAQYLGLIPFGVGLAHLITYKISQAKDPQ